jgi:hypothetical protein
VSGKVIYGSGVDDSCAALEMRHDVFRDVKHREDVDVECIFKLLR